jgi:hypothetical protein
MNQRVFNQVSGIIFAIVVVVHLVRLYMGWPVVIGTWAAPTWLSWVGCVVAGTLAYSGLRLYLSRP